MQAAPILYPLQQMYGWTMEFLSCNWLNCLPKSISCYFMLEVTLKGFRGLIPWEKFSFHFLIWHQMTRMVQYLCFLIIYLQLLLVPDKLSRMEVDYSSWQEMFFIVLMLAYWFFRMMPPA